MAAKTILYADDDENDVRLMAIALQKRGLAAEMQAVSDGADALDYLRRSGAFADRPPGDPKVVVLDLKMRMVDGFEALAQIRADPALAHIPVIILSSSALSKDVARCYELGANSYLTKPYSVGEFTDVVWEIASFVGVDTPDAEPG
jgi:CheY-like chemotaxis protein